MEAALQMPDAPQHETPPPAPAQPRFGTTKAALIGAVASAVVTGILAPWFDLFNRLPLPLRLWPPLAVAVLVAGLLHIPALGRFVVAHAQAIRLGLWALAGMALVGLLSVVVQGITAGSPCPVPTELRLVTAPENVVQLRERSRQYSGEQQRDGCPLLRMTVAAVPPPVHLLNAFNSDWEMEDRTGRPYARLHDLQPDAWVATSAAQPDDLRGRVSAQLGANLPVGEDQLVLAMTEGRKAELDRIMNDPDDYSFEKVWTTLTTEMGMKIARPYPETSVAALIATHDLFEGRGLAVSEYEQAPTKYQRAEQDLVTHGLGADTVNSLLCAFDRLADEPARQSGTTAGRPSGPGIVMLVPGHSVRDFNDDRVEGCPDTGQSHELVGVGHHELSRLDYQYVPVTWAGQRSAEKEALVEKFGQWLKSKPLFHHESIPGKGRATAHSLTTLSQLLLDKIRTPVDLRLMLDVSGSAARPVRVQAAEALRGQGRMLGPRDDVRVFGLGSRTEHGRAEVIDIASGRAPRLGAVATEIENAEFDRWDAPVSAGVRELGDGDGSAPVVLLTDGRLFDNEGGAGAAESIGEALAEASAVSGLYVIVFGPNDCAVSKLRGTSKPYVCVTASSTREPIADALLTVRRWR
ncbi:hypothetical protein ACIBQX_40975 [Nonomuraea sp. NPDC049714]|uniref:hypothetical protein n=1 Tax=Nonomuraea sp. NPDC049714 TaxID=3364357 RepID=UPI00379A2D09